MTSTAWNPWKVTAIGGKGAVIGGVLGAGGGALYGVTENRQSDERYRAAYANYMQSRGYASSA